MSEGYEVPLSYRGDTNDLTVFHPLSIFFSSFFSLSVKKIPFAGIERTSQRVRSHMVPLSYRSDRLPVDYVFNVEHEIKI